MEPFPFMPLRLTQRRRREEITRNPGGRIIQILLMLSACVVPCSQLFGHGGDSAGHVAAECTLRLFIRNKYKIDPFAGLASRIPRERDLFIEDVQNAVRLSDLTLLNPVSSDLFQAAREIRSIQSQLPPVEQTRVLEAWVLFVKECARSAPAQYPEYFDYSRLDFCGFRDEWQSIKADSGYTAAFFSREPLLGFMGILGFVGDALTFLPNVVVREMKDLKKQRARKKSVKAARDFIRLVSVYEREYGNPGHKPR
jgi:hypothetical protein